MSSSKINPTDINILGFGQVIPEGMTWSACPNRATKIDFGTVLKDRKASKFFSKQDSLALLACHQAWTMANIVDPNYHDRTGIYLCVGILPFEDKPLQKIAELSQTDGMLDMQKSSTDSFNAMNPLLTFKCLPNMPLYHVSATLGITGRYFMTYPGIPEWFSALERAVFDLQSGLVDYAIVGAAADQNNYLVQHHIRRIRPELLEKLVDVSSAMVLTTQKTASPLARITRIETKYQAFNPLENKSLLVQSSDSFFAHAGVVEPSLHLNLKLQEKSTREISYSWKGSETNSCSMTVELI
ncbi:MAG: hypothetical protein A2X86_11755 [Bdellovibrionales bacterium GWA2_49_15]|nr:MAG: hypothetical protein A2X86_11755 [Bdellovibrionales bacterium GWA2_49_15]